jgi:hypothetical protein
MKRILIILAVGLFFFASCKKKYTSTTTVIRDCTGTYLRIDGKDNPVCNSRVLKNFADGETVNATYKKVGDGKCADRNNPVCLMIHPYEVGEWIEVTKIK